MLPFIYLGYSVLTQQQKSNQDSAQVELGPPGCIQLAWVFGGSGLDWKASCGSLEVPFFCDSEEITSGACILLPAGFSLGLMEKGKCWEVVLPVVNAFQAHCVPLCSGSGQLPSCRVLLLSTAGGPCL